MINNSLVYIRPQDVPVVKQIEEARKALKVLDAAEAGKVPLPDWAKPENANNAVNLEKLDKVGVAPKVMEPTVVNPNG